MTQPPSDMSLDEINDLRRRALAGEKITLSEYSAFIKAFRQRRAETIKKKAEKPLKPSKPEKPSKPKVELPDFFKDL